MFILQNITSFLAKYDNDKKRIEERIEKEAEGWTDSIKWRPQMTIRAETFVQPPLFQVENTDGGVSDDMPAAQVAFSPKRNWAYTRAVLPCGYKLACSFGRLIGDVVFDGPVVIPRIHQRGNDGEWTRNPWMSITPQEILTMRSGTRFARGTTIIGGLGMGYQLEKVCRRKNVKKVIVVERDPDLIDWISPKLDLNGKDVEFVIGDANKIIPKMNADAALIDIYESYGWNEFSSCPNIKKVWVWGAAKLSR